MPLANGQCHLTCHLCNLLCKCYSLHPTTLMNFLRCSPGWHFECSPERDPEPVLPRQTTPEILTHFISGRWQIVVVWGNLLHRVVEPIEFLSTGLCSVVLHPGSPSSLPPQAFPFPGGFSLGRLPNETLSQKSHSQTQNLPPERMLFSNQVLASFQNNYPHSISLPLGTLQHLFFSSWTTGGKAGDGISHAKRKKALTT